MENTWKTVHYRLCDSPSLELGDARGYGCGINDDNSMASGNGHGAMSGQGDDLTLGGFGNGCACGRTGPNGYGI